HAEILVCAALLAVAGLATAATALSGARRVWIPLVMALAFAWLGSSAAIPWVRAARAIDELRADVVRAQGICTADATGGAGGSAARVLVVDPPIDVGGLDLGLSDYSLLVDPALTRPSAAPVPFRDP